MPPQAAARAFEAFYPAKDAGKGTGFGLDVARRIVVERHNGTITIRSPPGETAQCVRVPVRPPRPRGKWSGDSLHAAGTATSSPFHSRPRPGRDTPP